jgi:hypothetical protein
VFLAQLDLEQLSQNVPRSARRCGIVMKRFMIAAEQDQFAFPAYGAQAIQHGRVPSAQAAQIESIEGVSVQNEAIEACLKQGGEARRLTVAGAQVKVADDQGHGHVGQLPLLGVAGPHPVGEAGSLTRPSTPFSAGLADLFAPR